MTLYLNFVDEVRRRSAGDSGRAGPEVGGGAKTTAGSPAAGCVTRFGGHCTRNPHIVPDPRQNAAGQFNE
jgi:hypothetical protein